MGLSTGHHGGFRVPIAWRPRAWPGAGQRGRRRAAATPKPTGCRNGHLNRVSGAATVTQAINRRFPAGQATNTGPAATGSSQGAAVRPAGRHATSPHPLSEIILFFGAQPELANKKIRQKRTRIAAWRVPADRLRPQAGARVIAIHWSGPWTAETGKGRVGEARGTAKGNEPLRIPNYENRRLAVARRPQPAPPSPFRCHHEATQPGRHSHRLNEALGRLTYLS